jgi:hypothetical protein
MNQRVTAREWGDEQSPEVNVVTRLVGTGSPHKFTVCRLTASAENARATANVAYSSGSKFAGKNILQPDFQFHENRFQFIQREAMLAVFNAKQRLMGNADLFRKFRIRKTAPLLSQKFCELFVQVALHNLKVAKSA